MFARVRRGCLESQVSSAAARAVSSISSSGSFGAPATWKAGGRAWVLFFGAALAGLFTFFGAGLGFGGAAFFFGLTAGFEGCFRSGRRPAMAISVPGKGEVFSGRPFSAYLGLRTSVSAIVGAPVSRTRVPG